MTVTGSDNDLRERALAHLRALTGNPSALFHSGQWEAISALVVDRRRSLVVQRTGWGKSAVYFVATLLIRELSGETRPTIIISPLLALMRDQVAAASRSGLRAVTINSANQEEWATIFAEISAHQLDIILVSPERLTHPIFQQEHLPILLAQAGLLVIDEAHCISDWGHDFRPDYRRIRSLLSALPTQFPVLATTATANSRVVADVAEQLGVGLDSESVYLLRGPLTRKSLRLAVIELPTVASRLGWLVTQLANLQGSGIIYALTISGAEDTAKFLRGNGFEVEAYTGRTDPQQRELYETRLKNNEVKALVATSALGMGFDKADLGFVVHLGAPSSPVAYYQQVGRAGRGTDNAEVLLLPGSEDREIWRYFATAAMPTEKIAQKVLETLAASDKPLSVATIEARVDIRRTRLELLLKVLAVEGVVEKVSGGWERTQLPWIFDVPRYERIAQARVAEQNSMLDFVRTKECRMQFLAQQLDDNSAERCGRCDNCVIAAGEQLWLSSVVTEQSLALAETALNHVGVQVDPRMIWPSGLTEVKGKISPDERVELGRVLTRLTDLGWGETIRKLFIADAQGIPIDSDISPQVLAGCIRVLKEWEWAERPVAVMNIASRSRPRLVRTLAAELAAVGKLVDLGEFNRVKSSAGKGNSAWRVRGLWNSFVLTEIQSEAIAQLHGPVLLVDDFIDSRWTLTIAGRLLKVAGAPAVLPFALGQLG